MSTPPVSAARTARLVGGLSPGRPAYRALADALRRQRHAPGEVVVVDNAPTSDATRHLVRRYPEVRYVRERRPGLSIARNTGLRRSSGSIVS